MNKLDSAMIPKLLIVIMAGAPSSVADSLIPRPHRVKPIHTPVDTTRSRSDVITVKFRDNFVIRLRDGRLTDLGTGALRDAALALADAAAGRWERTHSLPEAKLDQLRQTAQKNLGKAVADLNLQFNLFLAPGTDASATIDVLNALEIVEIALPIPLPVPLEELPDFEANPGYVDRASAGVPDFRASQGYLDRAPGGVGADCVWQLPGDAGAGIKVADLECSWNLDHEDLSLATLLGPEPSGFGDDSHGTAVLGQISSLNNGWGTTGIAYNSEVYVVSTRNQSLGIWDVGAAIIIALDTLAAGDVILIEQQTFGPCGLVAVEWIEPCYNAIQTAVGVGVIVVEAAGNGNQDLDASCYNVGHAPFLLENDSGAIIVGAGASPGGIDIDRSRLSFSNYGSTVDLQGWGENIYTTGFGDAYSADGKNRWYTSTFWGTSGASAIVTGACLLVQAAHKEATGSVLTPAQLKNFLQSTGSPQQAGTFPVTQNIGPRPNAAAALIASGAAQDVNSNGIPDCCDDGGCLQGGLACTTLVATAPPNCAIDARQPSTIDGVTQQGWSSMEVTVGPSGCSLNQIDVTVESLPTGPIPNFDGITQVGDVATITFDGIIPTRNWTCVSLAADPTQQVCLGNLPGDVNGDGTSNPALDLGALIDCINNPGSCSAWQENIDRTGIGAGVLDITRLIDLFNGAGSYDSFTGASFGGQACPSEIVCSTNTQCDDGDVCNGVETCDTTLGCQAGTPVACPAPQSCDPSDGICKDCLTAVDCPPDQVCDPITSSCVDCLDDPDCDDGLACTVDICDSGNFCINAPVDALCGGGDICTGVETCDATLGCQPGMPLACNDGNACNGAETCNPATGCQAGTPLECDDNDLCNGLESCDAALGCQSGTPLVCDDADVCNGLESCDAVIGCQLGTPLACDDDDDCNGVETCDAALGCQTGKPITCPAGELCDPSDGLCIACLVDADCDDDIACTLDICDSGNDCINAPLNTQCDDGNACNGVESCNATLGCQAGTPITCPSGEVCDPSDGSCIGCLVSVDCEDGIACTLNICDSGNICTFVPLHTVCDDNVECTSNVCDPADPASDVQGCVVTFNCSFLDDQCNVGVCNPSNGMCEVQPANELSICTDGSLCTFADFCVSGACMGTPVNCPGGEFCDLSDGSCVDCLVDTDCAAAQVCDPSSRFCVDCLGNVDCTGGQVCNPLNGICVDCLVNADCNDNVACTLDICDTGNACINLPQNSLCDDGIVCTVDNCTALGCLFLPVHSECLNNQFCDGAEFCDVIFGCQSGFDPCDDGVACTDDECNEAQEQCANTPNDIFCDDGDACNGAESCDAALGCLPGTGSTCGDGVVCPETEQCDAGGESSTCDDDCTIAFCGDGRVNVSAGEACDDAGESSTCDNDCTIAFCGDGNLNVSAGEVCDDGTDACGPCNATCSGAAVSCVGTGDQCNADRTCDPGGTDGNCDIAGGAINEGNACDDGQACSIGEICQSGFCTGGVAVDCRGTGDECSADNSCDEFGAEGNCDIIGGDINEGGACTDDGCFGFCVCLSGICTLP